MKWEGPINASDLEDKKNFNLSKTKFKIGNFHFSKKLEENETINQVAVTDLKDYLLEPWREIIVGLELEL